MDYMTPKERELLQNFLQQLEQTQAGAKDAQAEGMIREASARQPDAAYLLVQRAMGLDLALQAAQTQMARLQTELDAARTPVPAATGFLDSPNAWGRQAVPLSPSPQSTRPAASAAAAANPPPVAAPAAPSAWGSGMMGTLATTAAGVVAGSLLYQGIQGLMGHHTPSMASNSGSGLDGPPAGQLDSVRDTVARDDVPAADTWSTPDPDDQVDSDSTFLADADDASFGDDEFA